MAKRKKKKITGSKRRVIVLGCLSLFAIVSFVFYFCYYSYRIMVLEKSKSDLEQQLVTLKQDEENLNNDIVKLKDPEYIARFARENYMYSMDGEYIIKVNDEEETQNDKKNDFDYMYLIYASSGCLGLIILYIFIKHKKQ